MNLVYDRLSGTFSLETEDDVYFLGPFKHSILRLKNMGFSAAQATDAVLTAFFNMGAEVPMELIKRRSSLYFKKVKSAAV